MPLTLQSNSAAHIAAAHIINQITSLFRNIDVAFKDGIVAGGSMDGVAPDALKDALGEENLAKIAKIQKILN